MICESVLVVVLFRLALVKERFCGEYGMCEEKGFYMASSL
jgi:hypothetical protein